MKEQPYFEQVYEVVRLCPTGRVTTYGAIADFLSLGSARMVGYAMKNSFISENVPAHRVVNSQGRLSGKKAFGSPTMMEELLALEKVEVKNDKVVDFKNKLWKPSEELL